MFLQKKKLSCVVVKWLGSKPQMLVVAASNFKVDAFFHIGIAFLKARY